VSNTQALSRYERVVVENYQIINVSTFRNLLLEKVEQNRFKKESKILFPFSKRDFPKEV
jgi:hypothetical protein